MRHLLGIVVAGVVAFAGSARAGDPVVVELFTSQGCSSCPPADQLMDEIADREDVIALALHVDYWDYLGWRDSFGNRAFTARQRAYARAAGERSVYTPQMVVDGHEHIVGSKPMKLAEAMTAEMGEAKPVAVSLSRSGDVVSIALRPRNGPVAPSRVHLVTYLPSATVAIDRGENAGRTVVYRNVVTGWSVLSDWDGQGAWSGMASVPAGQPVAVLVQKATAGPIFGAAKLSR